MGVIVRLLQAMPLIIALVILAVIVYFVVSWALSPTKAKEVLIKLFTVLNSALSVIFGIASAYALFEGNEKVLELAAGFFVVALIALGITMICRWRFTKNHPDYKEKPLEAKTLDN